METIDVTLSQRLLDLGIEVVRTRRVLVRTTELNIILDFCAMCESSLQQISVQV